jgi:peptidoglycan/xylan/chitin deacetylase (PgdA/CDA1 family)
MWMEKTEPVIQKVSWPGGAKVAIMFDLILEAWQELPPVSTAMTPAFPQKAKDLGLKDHATLSWQMYGGRTGFRRMVDILAKYDVPAAVTCSALAAERWPDQVKAFSDAGNEILGHAYSQDHRMYYMNEEEELAEIRKCREVFEQVTGQRIVGWSSPGGQRGDHTLKNLLRDDFLYTRDTRDSDVPYVIHEEGGKRLVALGGSSAHDVTALRGGNGLTPFVEQFCRMLDQLREEGETRPQMMTAICHSTHLGRPEGGWALNECLKYATGFDDVWICRPRDVAETFLGQI